MGLEDFFGLDRGEGMSESAFEAFKEKMKAAATQIAAIKKEEGKQKKKEEDLSKILLKFIKTSQKKELCLLISRCIEQNIPASFILAVILLSNKELLVENANEFLMLKSAMQMSENMAKDSDGEGHDTKSIVFFQKDATMPLKIKIALDAWIKELMSQAEEKGEKMIKSCYDVKYLKDEDEYGNVNITEEKSVKNAIVFLIAYVIEDFMKQNDEESDFEKIKEFSEFIIKGILEKTAEAMEKMKLLK
ncbi:MAG: hypothetical protein WC806_00750 [Candidatus Gracilibacteria bacterium]|jgi:hypothetical protein